ncbi:MAG: MFS transporter [Oscillospiraceae bacterium]|nr:MFS transporter [Oscillospiraceae bacterium]
MNKQLYLEDHGKSRLVFIACFAAYTASYVGRINFSAALSAIVSSGLFSKPEGGLIGSAFFVVYGVFQIINGFLGDKISPFKMIISGLSLSCIANVAMTFCTTNTAMAVVWGFNGFALAQLWVAILKILASIINEEMRAKSCLHISATLPIGTVLAYLTASVSIKFFSWKHVFYSAAIILALAAAFFIAVSLIIKKDLVLRDTVIPEKFKSDEKGKKSKGLLALFAASGVLFLLPADAIHGAIKEGITTWMPTMLTEVYDTSAAFSVLLSICLPIFNISGAYIITPIYNKVFKKDEIKTGAAILVFTLIPLSLVIFMAKLPIYLSIVLLALCTTAMYTYNYVIITLVPMRFASTGKTATVTGFMNAIAYVGSAASSYGFGVVSENIGWGGTAGVWVGLCGAALLLTAASAKKWRSYFKNERV